MSVRMLDCSLAWDAACWSEAHYHSSVSDAVDADRKLFQRAQRTSNQWDERRKERLQVEYDPESVFGTNVVIVPDHEETAFIFVNTIG